MLRNQLITKRDLIQGFGDTSNWEAPKEQSRRLMDFYMRRNNDELVKALEGNIVVTFSVVDIDKACKLYKAYEKMKKNS